MTLIQHYRKVTGLRGMGFGLLPQCVIGGLWECGFSIWLPIFFVDKMRQLDEVISTVLLHVGITTLLWPRQLVLAYFLVRGSNDSLQCFQPV